MLDQLMRTSLRSRLAVLIGAAVLLAGGVMVALRMPIDVFPDLTAASTFQLRLRTRELLRYERERLSGQHVRKPVPTKRLRNYLTRVSCQVLHKCPELKVRLPPGIVSVETITIVKPDNSHDSGFPVNLCFHFYSFIELILLMY